MRGFEEFAHEILKLTATLSMKFCSISTSAISCTSSVGKCGGNPRINFNSLFCLTCKRFRCDLAQFCHTGDPYVSTGRKIHLNRSNLLASCRADLRLMSGYNALVSQFSLAMLSFICLSNNNFWSKISPRYFPSVVHLTGIPLIFNIDDGKWCTALLFVKKTIWVFNGFILILHRCWYSSSLFWACWSLVVTILASSWVVRKLVSSAKKPYTTSSTISTSLVNTLYNVGLKTEP